MQRDKGWDYNPGKDLKQGINRAAEQKLAKISGSLKSTTENMLKAWPGFHNRQDKLEDIFDLSPFS